MGKIKELLFDLVEAVKEFVEENPGADITDIKKYVRGLLEEDIYPFFLENINLILDLVTDETGPLSEARGLKGDVLRPWGGRRVRAKMGYGKGNRANYNPEDDEEQTHYIRRNEMGHIPWPEEIRDEENWDEDDDIPYPGGLTQDDYDLDYDHDADEDRYQNNDYNLDEQYIMKPLSNK